MRAFLGCGLLMALLGTMALAPLPKAEAGTPVGVRISLVSSLFRDTPDSLVKVLARPMLALMENQTGLVGELQPSSDAKALAEQLKSEKTQLGVFHGFELAWMQQKYP